MPRATPEAAACASTWLPSPRWSSPQCDLALGGGPVMGVQECERKWAGTPGWQRTEAAAPVARPRSPGGRPGSWDGGGWCRRASSLLRRWPSQDSCRGGGGLGTPWSQGLTPLRGLHGGRSPPPLASDLRALASLLPPDSGAQVVLVPAGWGGGEPGGDFWFQAWGDKGKGLGCPGKGSPCCSAGGTEMKPLRAPPPPLGRSREPWQAGEGKRGRQSLAGRGSQCPAPKLWEGG